MQARRNAIWQGCNVSNCAKAVLSREGGERGGGAHDVLDLLLRMVAHAEVVGHEADAQSEDGSRHHHAHDPCPAYAATQTAHII